MSFVCDGKFLVDQINDIGEDVVMKVVTIDSLNKYGDATKSTVDTTIKAIITSFSRSETGEEDSTFTNGDVLLVTAPANEPFVTPGDRALVAGELFEVFAVQKHRAFGQIYLIEASLRKL